MEKQSAPWLHSLLGKWQPNMFGGRKFGEKHLGEAAKQSRAKFEGVFGDSKARVEQLDSTIRERRAAIASMKSEGGGTRFSSRNMSSMEREVAALTKQRNSIMKNLSKQYGGMHKHHLNLASHTGNVAPVGELAKYKESIKGIGGPARSGALMDFIRRRKVPLIGAGAAAAVAGAYALSRRKQEPAQEYMEGL